MKREIDRFQEGEFDLLIIGGGITGAGVALDAVLRSLRVGLIDKGDFASGTSSVSSKLVHGGLRYLEHGGLHLVYEALHERKLLLKNAPHLVRPLPFTIPFYRDSRVAPWKWRAALTLYDLLAGRSGLRRSRPLDVNLLHDLFPQLKLDSLVGGAEYFDAQMDDARLCIEVIHTAALSGACVANYVEAIGFEQQAGQLRGVRALDRVGNAEFRIRARQILNATGPWVDLLCQLAGEADGRHLRPTKGVHILAPRQGIPTALLLLHPNDGRVFFVIPWMGKTLIGTTDTEADEQPDDLAITQADIEYLLAGYNQHLSPSLGAGDVQGSFVGLRPLIRARANDPSSLSREFQIFASPSGLVSVAGGKYTTYRRMAEIITDSLVRRLGKQRQCRTRDYRVHGCPERWEDFELSMPGTLARKYCISEESAQHLVNRYGACAEKVADYVKKDSSLAYPIMAGEPDLRAELSYQRDHEMAIYPEDFLLRRSRLGLFNPRFLKDEIQDLLRLGARK
jgi:glycerol-3-phosphate dehydrogenase